MWLLAGLGNPGAEYVETRHNAGFMAIDAIASRYGFSGWQRKFHGDVATGEIAGERVLLLKPQTFMNRSGTSLAEAASFYKIPPERVIVFHDELDLLPGKLRVKKGGGAGGHNGLKDIDSRMNKNYWRVRIGIGHPGRPEQVTGYVLHRFSKDENPVIEKIIDVLAAATPLLLDGEPEKLMSQVAMEMAPPKPKQAKPPKPMTSEGNE